jgi:hypothetical protein
MARILPIEVAGISAPDQGNTNAALRSYSAERRLALVACFESASGLFRPVPSLAQFDLWWPGLNFAVACFGLSLPCRITLPPDLPQTAEDLADAMVADIVESWPPDEIRQLIEEMEAKQRKPH